MQPEFTAVVTCYFEEQSIEEFHRRLSDACKATGRSYELVMINDGSTDGTFKKLQEIYQKDPNVSCIINFTKNFGQGAAMTAGIMEGVGEKYIFMDSDLQLDPEQLPELISESDKGVDVVSGFRKSRKDPLMRKIFSMMARAVLQRSSKTNAKDLGCTFRVVRGNLVRGIGFSPLKLFSQTILLANTNLHSEIEVRHHNRKYGRSGWTFWKLLDFYIENLLSTSNRVFQYFSIGVALLAGLIFLRLLLSFAVDFSLLSTITPGFLFHAEVIGVLVTLASVAIVGEFTVRCFRSLNGNPLYVIRSVARRREHIPAAHDYTKYHQSGARAVMGKVS